MADLYPLLVEDGEYTGNSPSGIYLAGALRADLGEGAANDQDAQSDMPVSLQSFRALLGGFLASKKVQLEDPGAAEIDIPGSNIQIAVRLHTYEGKDYWEIWLKSPDGELQVGPDMEVRLQLLALSLSARTDPANEFLPMQLSVVSHQYVAQKDVKRNITHAYVKTVDGDVVPGSTSAEALALMRLAHKYILNALSSGQLPKKLDQ